MAKADCRLRNAVHYGAEKSPAILRVCWLLKIRKMNGVEKERKEE